MRYEEVCIESLGYTLPEEVVASAEIERRLAPLYQRLRLPEGRLELISGVRERRFWPVGTMPSSMSLLSARRALEAAEIAPERIGALIHASVCRDYLEPATACSVHHRLGLPPSCIVYDLSNACLGLLNGMVQIANMIELGQIEAGIVVGSEGSRQLVENTIDWLNGETSLTRQSVKSAIASLTIGSASCAILLTRRAISRTGNRLWQVTVRAHTEFHDLCHSGCDEAVGSGMNPLMDTDSERLLEEGIATGKAAFTEFLRQADCVPESLQRTICHQVGSAHRKRMLEALGLRLERDFSTLEWLGNTGSVALPITLALAAEQQAIRSGDQVGLLGIGSGINCLLCAIDWRQSRVRGNGGAVHAIPKPHFDAAAAPAAIGGREEVRFSDTAR
ncbi:MAG: 3-oxoacyl-ACP synthase III [Planctomycetes bacterium]|nr:3-oxoacyl-ACP synthase III [Planctomycetota bacterium]